jgi:MoaD family protein
MTNDKREEDLDVEERLSIADFLDLLAKRYGESFRKAVYEPKGTDVKSNYIITVNGYLLNQLNGIETKLKNGDHVTLLPIVSGG